MTEPCPQALFLRLVEVVRAGGGFVSPKLRRKEPVEGSPGLFAEEALVAGEELLRVPAGLQLTHSVVADLGGHLVPAVAGLRLRVAAPEVVAFVAQRLQRLGARGPEGGWATASWLDLLLGTQLGSDFSGLLPKRLEAVGADLLPKRLEIASAELLPRRLGEVVVGAEPNSSEAAALLQMWGPSAELHGAAASLDALKEAYRIISKSKDCCPAAGEGSSALPSTSLPFAWHRFLQAHLLLLTRTFAALAPGSSSPVHCLVPVADMFNHAASPSVVDDVSSLRHTVKMAPRRLLRCRSCDPLLVLLLVVVVVVASVTGSPPESHISQSTFLRWRS
ncbi:unnamed protein product [Polarella glacialis]|uniref:SET domain-containing protein n=1 Tax=Polarella glacialis TaxID=89957 RepID=A0A813E109_POLGL|nr:unnamed protein product [Polarella glacialis]